METLVHKSDGTLRSINPYHVGREVRYGKTKMYRGTIVTEKGHYPEEVMVKYARYDKSSRWTGRTLSTPKKQLEFLDEL